MENYRKVYGINLRALRKSKGWTIGALAYISGVSATTINNAELSRVMPMLYSAMLIADALGVGIDSMLIDNNKTEQPKV